MLNFINQNVNWCGEKIIFESGKVANKTNSSVILRTSNCQILCIITYKKNINNINNFIPLTVNYHEKYYSSGIFPGGFIKRETKSTEREILISRLIDRSLRPLLIYYSPYEININCIVLSYDIKKSLDILSIIGSSVALKLSSIFHKNTLGSIKIGIINNSLCINPTINELLYSDLSIIVSSTSKSIIMIESSSNEISEHLIFLSIEFAYKSSQYIINFINNYIKDKYISKKNNNITNKIKLQIFCFFKYLFKKNKNKKYLNNIYKNVFNKNKKIFKANLLDLELNLLIKSIIKDKILYNKIRLDNRCFFSIRKIICEIGYLYIPHGSSLFTKGNTQSLSTVTLGNYKDIQMLYNVSGVNYKRFILHYNFPNYSTGSYGINKYIGRRELGHGNLAYKSLKYIIPRKQKFPYTIRVVSDITESDGSSSMATICSASLSLIDAGVPIYNIVSGIAMGIILKKNNYQILSDISAVEDSCGNMDLKLTSSLKGITAIQMDIKLDKICIEIIKKSIFKAKLICIKIINNMIPIIDINKRGLNNLSPYILSLYIKKLKIKDLIGPSGKIIKKICYESKSKIDIEENGNISIITKNIKNMNIAKKMIYNIISYPIISYNYYGIITKINSFGFFVKFLGSYEGFLSRNEIFYIKRIKNYFFKFDIIKVKYIGINQNNNKISLSIKNVKQY